MASEQIATIERARSPFFYGWVVAGASAAATACSISVFLPATISLMVSPLHQAFGWSAQAVFAAIMVVAAATTAVAPLIGKLIDRVGAVRLLVVSFIAEGLLIASFKYLTGDLLWFYARYAALAVLATGTTSIAYSTILSRWFDRRRGLALGISLAGVGVGGAAWSLIAQFFFDRLGWRDAFPLMGLLIVVTMVPLVTILIRDDPAVMGLHVDGAAGPGLQAAPAFGAKASAVFRSGLFWLMATTFFLMAVILYGAMLNLTPLLKSRGVSAQTAAAAQAVQWIVVVFGRVATGHLLDRFFAPRVAIALLTLPFIGIAMLAAGVSGPAVFFAAILIGLAVGAEGDMLAYMTGGYFGLQNYGLIYAVFYGLYGVGTGFGPTIVAGVARAHGYAPVLWGLCGVTAVIAIMLARLPRFPAAPARPEPPLVEYA